MDYIEEVRKKIAGQADEIERRRKIWQKITIAYQQGGTIKVRSAVTEQIEGLKGEFDKLLGQLKEKL